MNLAQSLPISVSHEINSHERVSRASLALFQTRMSEESSKDHKLGGFAAVLLTFYAIGIAESRVLDAVRLIPSVAGAPGSTPSLSDNAGAHYHLLQQAQTYGYLGEVMTRIAAVGLYRIVDNALKKNRQLRSHRKGVLSRNKPKSLVLQEVATQILRDLAPVREVLPTIGFVIAQINSTSKRGRVFHELSAKFGEGIIVLFPSTNMLPMRNFDE